MYRFTTVLASLLVVGSVSQAQVQPIIRGIEVGLDIGYQVNRSNDVSRGANAPVSFRYGAVNSKYRFTIDQRATFGDRRVFEGKAPLTIDTELGWRLGSAERVRSSVLGPYLFTSFHLSSPDPYFKDAARHRAGLGFGGGVGTRVTLFQIVLRPELVVGHDLGSGVRGDQYWIPSRNRIGVRLGYGYRFGSGDK